MNSETAVAHLSTLGDAQKAQATQSAQKAPRTYLGIELSDLDALAKTWRALDMDERLTLARGLWDSDIHEARICAAKILTQARIRPDDTAVWDMIVGWLPDCDGLAIANAVCVAGQKRVVWDASRLDQVEEWTTSEHLWTRRAALIITLPWTKQNDPKPAEEAIRERVLGWAATLAEDPDFVIQKAIAWWLRDLSKHDVPMVQTFLEEHGGLMNKAARKEASVLLD